MNSKLRVGVIGLGYWGPNLVRNFYKTSDVVVVGVSDFSKEKLKVISNDYPSIKLFTKDYKKILKHKGIDAVAIATPVKTHHKLAKEALEAGKHVLIEKPMVSSIAETEELLEIAEKKKLTIMVDHTFIYTPQVRKIKELVKRGEIGDIHYIDSTRINLGLIQSDVNVIWDLAPHDISIINFLLEKKPISISAIGMNHPKDTKEAVAYVTIRYSDNILAHISVSWFSPVKLRTMLIGGSKKMIIYDHIHPSESVKVYDHGIEIKNSKQNPFNPIHRSGDVWIPKIDSGEGLEEVCRHFFDSIRMSRKPLTSGVEGLEVVRLLEAADKSLKLKGAEISI